LNELIAWVEAHPDIVSGLDKRLDDVEAILDGFGDDTEPATVKGYVDETFATKDEISKAGYAVASEVANDYVTKVTATADSGLRFINQTEIDKLAKLNLDNGEITISGSVNASQVKELYNTVVNIVKGSTADLDPDVEGAQNGLGVEEGAEVNIIEEIQINGTKVTPNENRVVNLQLSTNSLSDKQALTQSISDAAALGQQGIDNAATAQSTANEALGKANTNANDILTLKGIVNGNGEGADGLVKRLAALETEVGEVA
jgi:hypothetical protein